MYEILFFIKYISQKKEKEVNNLTPDCVQNFIYPLVGFKCDSIKQNILNKSQNLLLKDFIKTSFLLLIILSALDIIQKRP